MGEKLLRLLPPGTHDWNQYINQEEIEDVINERGFRTLGKAGVMVTNPLTLEMGEFPNWLRANYVMISKRID